MQWLEQERRDHQHSAHYVGRHPQRPSLGLGRNILLLSCVIVQLVGGCVCGYVMPMTFPPLLQKCSLAQKRLAIPKSMRQTSTRKAQVQNPSRDTKLTVGTVCHALPCNQTYLMLHEYRNGWGTMYTNWVPWHGTSFTPALHKWGGGRCGEPGSHS